MITALSFLVFFISSYVIVSSAKSMPCWLISPSAMMAIFFVLMVAPGIIFDYRDDIVTKALIGYNLWMLGSAFGVILSGLFFKRNIQSVNKYNYTSDGYQNGNYKLFMFFVFASIPAVIITFSMLGRIPLFTGLGSALGDVSDMSMQQARRMNTLEHRDGDTFYFGQGYFRQVYAVLSPVFLVAAHILVYSTQDTRKKRVILFMKVFLIFASALNGQIWISATVILLFSMGSMAATYKKKDKSFSNIKIIKNGFIAYVFIILFIFLYRYFQYAQGRHFENFLSETLSRIYLPGAIEIFDIFSKNMPFRYGSTWLNDLSGMLPGSTQSFAYEVHYLVHGGAWGYTLSPGIVASTYANFGFIGIFIASLVITTIFNTIYYNLITSNGAIYIAVAVYISHSFTLAMPGDISNYVISLVTGLLIIWAYNIGNRIYGHNYMRIE